MCKYSFKSRGRYIFLLEEEIQPKFCVKLLVRSYMVKQAMVVVYFSDETTAYEH